MNTFRKSLVPAFLLLWVLCLYGGEKGESVFILSFDQNPASRDNGAEWVMLFNPSGVKADITGWSLHTRCHGGKKYILGKAVIPPKQALPVFQPGVWLRNDDERITLKNRRGKVMDATAVCSDRDNDNRFWLREGNMPGRPDKEKGGNAPVKREWRYGLQDLKKGEALNTKILYVADADTVVVSPLGNAGAQRVRLVGYDAPEMKTASGKKLKKRMMDLYLYKTVEIDPDDLDQYDKYNRVLAVISVNGRNINRQFQRIKGVRPLIIPPSEFVPYADFSFEPAVPAPGQRVAFDASGSWTLDPDAAVISYTWTIERTAGGRGSGLQTCKGKTVYHTFSGPGTFRVVLTVRDSDGKKRRSNSRARIVRVGKQRR